MLSWNWRVSIASSKPPLSKAEASKYKLDISDGTPKTSPNPDPYPYPYTHSNSNPDPDLDRNPHPHQAR